MQKKFLMLAGVVLTGILLGLAPQPSVADQARSVEIGSAVAGVEAEFTVARESGGSSPGLIIFRASRNANKSRWMKRSINLGYTVSDQ